MDYTITSSPDNRYIIIEVLTSITRSIARSIVIDSQALGKKLGVNKYLQDMTHSQNNESMFETYRFANEDMKNDTVDRTALVALLIRSDDHSHDFMETVARNSGLQVKLFTDREKAIHYLLSN